MKYFTYFIGMLLCLWCVGFVVFLGSLGFKRPSLQQIEGIVVFTGDEGRIEEGMWLLEKGVSNYLLISGIIEPNQPIHYKKITYGPAQDTIENVKETVLWARHFGLKKILLVTSDYHIYRSMFLFHKEKDCDLEIIPWAVFQSSWDFNHFIRTHREYCKFLLTVIHNFY